MPIWFELVALSLAAYAIGLGIGWALWSGSFEKPAGSPDPSDTNGETTAS